ncbi:MFS transporter [Arvimicrobium flavum]|uniref:MFS transporter n=1 Tax=Arvimicrobium flavum TaxID=3393320 RepID=UPI00237BEB6B|nr:MFS transporter [Mesorhizobium shangrilense]
MLQRSPTLAPFQHQNFRTLWSATLISNLGGLVQAVGAGWLMTTITDSKSMVALVQGATTLPIMLFSLASGALADNFDRRRIMLTAQVIMMLASVVLAVVAVQGLLTPWLMLGITFVIGCGTALHNPSWQASMGDMVPREDLAAAVTLNAMGFNLMRSVGPAIGGIIVATAGAAAAFILNAVSYVALIVALLRWKPAYAVSKLPRESFGRAVAAGLRYIAMSPNLLTVMLRSFLFGLAAVAILALLPLVASELLVGGALTYGSLLGSFGIGAIGGGLLNSSLRERLSNETIVRLASLGFAASCVLLAFSREVWLSHLLLLPVGACWVLALSLFNVTVQLSTPRWVVGRALSLYQTATFGGMAAGSWLWGAVADVHGASLALVGSGVVLVLAAVVGLWFRLPEFSSLNLNPLDQFREPELRLDLKARSGPIMIMVDFRIAQEDVPAFLTAMADRRRIRIRDGARQWVLLRDLENPEIWTESYHVPTWVEYVRHNQRRTHADAEVTQRLLKLHRGPESPRVHRMIERQTVPLQDDMPLKETPEIH